MKVISLQSGSNGNCFYVESGEVSLLFDAGISGKTAADRLAEHGRDIRNVDALFISHDHSDHTRCMGVFNRKFQLPIYITQPTLLAVQKWQKIGQINQVRFFTAGSSQVFGHLAVHTIPTPHDSVDGVVFVVDDGEHRVGILTDLGHAFDGLKDVLQSLDAVIIESNYDERMLADGPYPERLKNRIAGSGGHLSNREAATLIKEHSNGRLKWACLCHLSDENNEPHLAVETHQKILAGRIPIHVAWRDRVGDLLEL